MTTTVGEFVGASLDCVTRATNITEKNYMMIHLKLKISTKVNQAWFKKNNNKRYIQDILKIDL